MNTKYTILQGVPIPPPRAKKKSPMREAVESLKPGDHVSIPLTKDVTRAAVACAIASAKADTKGTYVTRTTKDPDGKEMSVGIWRTK